MSSRSYIHRLPERRGARFGYWMSKLVLAAAITALATGCGAYALPGSIASPTPRGATHYDVTATQADHNVTMRVGQRLEVVLLAAEGMTGWTHPDSSDRSVLAPIVDPLANAAHRVTLAAFQATKAGQAEVRATSSPQCSPAQACPMLLSVYSLKVTVTR